MDQEHRRRYDPFWASIALNLLMMSACSVAIVAAMHHGEWHAHALSAHSSQLAAHMDTHRATWLKRS